MFHAAQGFLRGVFGTVTILGSLIFFRATCQYPLELCRHFEDVLLGEYQVATTPPKIALCFGVWCIMVLTMSVIADSGEPIERDDK